VAKAAAEARLRWAASSRALPPFFAAVALGVSGALAGVPNICQNDDAWRAQRAPGVVLEYLESPDSAAFDMRVACARWAASFSNKHQAFARRPATGALPPPRFIVFPGRGLALRELAVWSSRSPGVRSVQRATDFVVVELDPRAGATRMRQILEAPQVEYFEPDCDGPDFLTTSLELPEMQATGRDCWQHAARSAYPNDPCMDALWGHQKIGWDSSVAARSVPRMVAVLDSGIDSHHADLALNVMHVSRREPAHSQASYLNSMCATSGRCYPHGTEMAGTIGGRMDNGIGVAGVAPNSRLLPIVISQVDRGLLARLSTIAEGIDAAAQANVDVINISAKWPVDSRAISTAIRRAVDGEALGKRLIVTGYSTSLDFDDSVREYYPSLYRCLPGVVAAVPTDMRGHELFNPKGVPDATDGRIQAPGVDIVVTTTENSEQGYALSESAGSSSAAAYVSGAVALVWGSPPLDQCGAQEIKQLLFCRSKSSDSTRYPWINVDFLHELGRIDAGADCHTAMEALGCD
jgi:subtilisin family serine protease